MDINLDALRRQSRVAGVLSGVATVIVVGALYLSFHQTVGAKQDLETVRVQENQASTENAHLRTDVGQLQSTKNKYAEALSATVANSPEAAKALSDSISQSPELATAIPRVFIHMNGSSKTALALQIQKDLKAQGFVVPAPDKLPPINGKVAAWRLHYSYRDAVTESDVAKIQAVFKADQIPLAASYISYAPTPPPRTYAIYLGTE
jgi:hypothetical protein